MTKKKIALINKFFLNTPSTKGRTIITTSVNKLNEYGKCFPMLQLGLEKSALQIKLAKFKLKILRTRKSKFKPKKPTGFLSLHRRV